ncbi:MAG: DUF3422 domain-containing protein [Rubrivivax sp.]|nr:DUF3422 domain-containing protein [Rubrivivax sp.]
MSMLPPDHPERATLAAEVHARPPEALDTPSRASYVAVLVGETEREAERTHLAALCAHFGVPPPAQGSTHFRATLGDGLRVKWERHGEFSGYTFYRTGLSPQPFAEPPVALLPAGWLAALPGRTMAAAHAKLVPAGAALPDAAELSRHFGEHIVVGAEIGDGAGLAYTDFRMHEDGFTRFLVLNRSFTPRQAGRTLQRLFEIEAYRMMSLLALPTARALLPRIVAIEAALARLTAAIAGGAVGAASGGSVGSAGNAGERSAREAAAADEALLHELTRLAAEVEQALSASQFRFGACRAYAELVTTRIAELRERRLAGLQPVDEFMARRFKPAVATVQTAAQRLQVLSERVAQASNLLSTRVDIARERQNQALLASMDRRAKLQLRLQQTVEGLSVAAIVYYVAGLVGYLAKAAKQTGLPVQPDLAVGVAIPIVAVAALAAVRKARRHASEGDRPH